MVSRMDLGHGNRQGNGEPVSVENNDYKVGHRNVRSRCPVDWRRARMFRTGTSTVFQQDFGACDIDFFAGLLGIENGGSGEASAWKKRCKSLSRRLW